MFGAPGYPDRDYAGALVLAFEWSIWILDMYIDLDLLKLFLGGMRYDIGLGIRLVDRLGLGYIAWNGSVFLPPSILIVCIHDTSLVG